MEAFSHATMISASLAPGFAKARLSRTVPANRCVSCVMKPSTSRRLAVATRRTSRPDTSIAPLLTSQKRMNSLSRVDFPDPERPAMRTT